MSTATNDDERILKLFPAPIPSPTGWAPGGVGGGAVTSLERVKITFRERSAYLSLANLTLVSERTLCACLCVGYMRFLPVRIV